MAIKSHCISSTSTFISQKRLSEEMGCCLSSVEKAVRELKKIGAIEVTSRGRTKTRIIHVRPVKSYGPDPYSVTGPDPENVTGIRRLIEEDKHNNNCDTKVNNQGEELTAFKCGEKEGEMGWKEDADNIEKVSRERTEEARTRERAPFRGAEGVEPEKNHKDVVKRFRDIHFRVIGNYPIVSHKARAQVKRWIEEVGIDSVFNVLTHVEEDFWTLREEMGWNNLTLGTLYGFRSGIVMKMREGEKKKATMAPSLTGNETEMPSWNDLKAAGG